MKPLLVSWNNKTKFVYYEESEISLIDLKLSIIKKFDENEIEKINSIHFDLQGVNVEIEDNLDFEAFLKDYSNCHIFINNSLKNKEEDLSQGLEVVKSLVKGVEELIRVLRLCISKEQPLDESLNLPSMEDLNLSTYFPKRPQITETEPTHISRSVDQKVEDSKETVRPHPNIDSSHSQAKSPNLSTLPTNYYTNPNVPENQRPVPHSQYNPAQIYPSLPLPHNIPSDNLPQMPGSLPPPQSAHSMNMPLPPSMSRTPGNSQSSLHESVPKNLPPSHIMPSMNRNVPHSISQLHQSVRPLPAGLPSPHLIPPMSGNLPYAHHMSGNVPSSQSMSGNMLPPQYHNFPGNLPSSQSMSGNVLPPQYHNYPGNVPPPHSNPPSSNSMIPGMPSVYNFPGYLAPPISGNMPSSHSIPQPPSNQRNWQ